MKDSLTNDVSPHDGVNDDIGLCGWLAVHNIVSGRFSSQSKGSEGVHDYIDPKKLDGGEWLLSEEASTGEDEEHSDDVDSELELKELADIVIDVTAIFDSGQDGAEVVIRENNIAGALGNIGSSNSHSETNIRSVESRGVISAITSHSNSLSNLDQTINKHKLVIRSRSGHNL